MCIENTHFKCLKNYYRDLRVEVTHLFLEWYFCKYEIVTIFSNVRKKIWSIQSNLGYFEEIFS